jgi:hypothetical protein
MFRLIVSKALTGCSIILTSAETGVKYDVSVTKQMRRIYAQSIALFHAKPIA